MSGIGNIFEELIELYTLENNKNYLDLVDFFSHKSSKSIHHDQYDLIKRKYHETDEQLLIDFEKWMDSCAITQLKDEVLSSEDAATMLVDSTFNVQDKSITAFESMLKSIHFEESTSIGKYLCLKPSAHRQGPMKTTEQEAEEEKLTNDLDLYHLYLQLESLPIYRLLQSTHKSVTTEDWLFAIREVKYLKILESFESYKSNLTNILFQVHSNPQLLIDYNQKNYGDKSKLSISIHGRKRKSHWDFLLEEVEWMSIDFASERKWKIRNAKKTAIIISKYFESKTKRAAIDSKLSRIHLDPYSSEDVDEHSLISTKKMNYKSSIYVDEHEKDDGYYSHLFDFNSEFGIYGPPDPKEFQKNDYDSIFSDLIQGSLDQKDKKSLLGPFKLEEVPVSPKKITDYLPVANVNVPSWSSLEDYCIYVFTKNKSLVNWEYLSDFINDQYHHGHQIRNSSTVQKRAEKLKKGLSHEELVNLGVKLASSLFHAYSMIKKKSKSKNLLLKLSNTQISKKILLTAHTSHDAAVKKNAGSAAFKISTPAELSIKKSQKAKAMASQISSQNIVSVPISSNESATPNIMNFHPSTTTGQRQIPGQSLSIPNYNHPALVSIQRPMLQNNPGLLNLQGLQYAAPAATGGLSLSLGTNSPYIAQQVSLIQQQQAAVIQQQQAAAATAQQNPTHSPNRRPTQTVPGAPSQVSSIQGPPMSTPSQTHAPRPPSVPIVTQYGMRPAMIPTSMANPIGVSSAGRPMMIGVKQSLHTKTTPNMTGSQPTPQFPFSSTTAPRSPVINQQSQYKSPYSTMEASQQSEKPTLLVPGSSAASLSPSQTSSHRLNSPFPASYPLGQTPVSYHASKQQQQQQQQQQLKQSQPSTQTASNRPSPSTK